jgi:hypothetical protein
MMTETKVFLDSGFSVSTVYLTTRSVSSNHGHHSLLEGKWIPSTVGSKQKPQHGVTSKMAFTVRTLAPCCVLLSLNIFSLESTIFWDMAPYNPLKANRRFGGTYRLNLQGKRINRANRVLLPIWFHTRTLHGFTLQPLYLLRKNPQYPLDRKLDGPHSWSPQRGEEKFFDTIWTGTPTSRSSKP